MARNSLLRMWVHFNEGKNEGKTEQIRELRIESIRPNPYQPRQYFDSFQLEELAQSIKEFGVIQPVIVREKGNYYELIAGERRIRASLSLGKKTIPAIIKNLSNQEMAEIALIENLQREGLNFLEEAEGYLRLISEFNLTQEEVARRVGKSQSAIANKLRLLKLSPTIREKLDLEVITERHARALLRLLSTELQALALEEIYKKGLNVRETEAFIAEQLALQEKALKNNKEKHIVRIFTDIRLYLNTLRSAVAAIKEAGLKVNMLEKDHDNHIEVLIKIYKPQSGRKRLFK